MFKKGVLALILSASVGLAGCHGTSRTAVRADYDRVPYDPYMIDPAYDLREMVEGGNVNHSYYPYRPFYLYGGPFFYPYSVYDLYPTFFFGFDYFYGYPHRYFIADHSRRVRPGSRSLHGGRKGASSDSDRNLRGGGLR